MTAETLKRIIIPTVTQVIVSVCLSVLLFVVAFKDGLYSLFFSQGDSFAPYFSQSYQAQLSLISNSPIVDFLVKALFWAGVGLVAYLIFLGISNVFIEARNEAVVEAEYTNKDKISRRLHKPLMQLGMAVVLIVAMLISVSLLLPFWLQSFESGFAGPLGIMSVVGPLIAVIGTSVNICLLWSLGQVVFAIN